MKLFHLQALYLIVSLALLFGSESVKASETSTESMSPASTLFTQDDLGNTKIHRAFEATDKNEPMWTLSLWFETQVSNTTLKNKAGETPFDVALKKGDLTAAFEIVIHELVLTHNSIVVRSDNEMTVVRSEFLKRYVKKVIEKHHQKKSLKKIAQIISTLSTVLDQLFTQDALGNGRAHTAVMNKDYALLESLLCSCDKIDLDITDMYNNVGQSPLDVAVEMKDRKSVSLICRHLLLSERSKCADEKLYPFEKLFEYAFALRHQACLKACLAMILWFKTDSQWPAINIGVRYLRREPNVPEVPRFSALHLAACASSASVKALLHDDEHPSLFRPRTRVVFAAHSTEENMPRVVRRGNPMRCESGRFTPLHAAAYAANSEAIALLLEQGALVNFQDDFWRTPLHFLVYALNNRLEDPQYKGDEKEIDYYNAASVLLAHGASVELEDGQNLTPILALSRSRGSGEKDMLLKLFLAHLPHGNAYRLELPPAHDAATFRPSDLSLSSHDFKIASFRRRHAYSAASDFDSILKAVQSGEIDDLESKFTPTCEREDHDDDSSEPRSIRSIVLNSTELDTMTQQGSSLLHEATLRGHAAWVQFLLERGANPHIRNSSHNFSGTTPSGTTPLGCAVACTNAAARSHMIQALLRAGASPNINIQSKSKSRETPLHRAVGYFDETLVKNLLDAGALPNLADEKYNTELHELFEEHAYHTADSRELQKMILIYLLKAGSSVLLENEKGKSALEVLFNSTYFDEHDEALMKEILNDAFNRSPSFRFALLSAGNFCTQDTPLKKTAIEHLKRVLTVPHQ